VQALRRLPRERGAMSIGMRPSWQPAMIADDLRGQAPCYEVVAVDLASSYVATMFGCSRRAAIRASFKNISQLFAVREMRLNFLSDDLDET
jgi:hypothetical protein